MSITKNIASALAITAVAAPALFAASAFQNQVGFMTNSQKQMAVLDAEGKKVVIKDADGKEALTVEVPKAEKWSPAGDSLIASLVDFSELKTPGTYQAYVGDEAIGHPIIIADDALEAATKASLKFFYFQRASMELTEEFAGIYARAAGHPDTAVKYHPSTGIEDTEATFDGSKGWYDAGDYGKYIVNSSISVYSLLQLYQQNKEYFSKLDLNIPESKNEVPDILDEIRWNLEWMLTMQDKDGGIFHKLTTKQFAGTVMPAKATAQRYAIGKGVEASWDFAATMTLAAEIYKPFDAEFSEKCIIAAQHAHNWAAKNPSAIYVQPGDVGTGSYTNSTEWATRVWGLIELYRISKDPSILEEIHKWPISRKKGKLQSWGNKYMLGIFTLATNPDIFEKDMVDTAQGIITDLADNYLKTLDSNGYGIALETADFNWGSNGTASNKAMILIHAYIITKEEKYYNAALGIVDYILGRNPMDISYLTGFGVKSTMNPHHRPSQADGIEAPVPGMIAGGPNTGATDCAKTIAKNNPPAKAYNDNTCSYATNEVAINWNAPFAYVIGSLQAIASTGKTYDMAEAPEAKYELTSIPFARQSLKKSNVMDSGKRLVIRGNKVQVEYIDNNGVKSYFNVGGKRVR
ncbi:MAG: glycoside hydrolase family 9 protein [Fibrobacter sp.]|nr:glycoside hydrolase family 9 protein [Fibrobacter sp.]